MTGRHQGICPLDHGHGRRALGYGYRLNPSLQVVDQRLTAFADLEGFSYPSNVLPDVIEAVWRQRHQARIEAGQLLNRALDVSQADGTDLTLGLSDDVRRFQLLEER